MHGTGTPLGDPIEIGAATAILIGRHIKSNIFAQFQIHIYYFFQVNTKPPHTQWYASAMQALPLHICTP